VRDGSRVEAAEAVARDWNRIGVPYVVMHGLERHPDSLGRDLDILMTGQNAERALERAAVVLSGLGWSVAWPPELWGRRLVALKGDKADNLQYLEFHTMTSLRWAALVLVGDDRADGSIGPFPTNSWATFAKTVLTPLLARDLARFDSDSYLTGLRTRSCNFELVKGRLSPVFGPGMAHRLVSAVEHLDLDQLKDLSNPLRLAAVEHMLRHPIHMVSNLPRFVIQKAGRFLSSSGLRARMLGPPFIDMDPIVEDVVDQVSRVYVTVDVSKTRSLYQSLVQQYRTMSRQGLILELEQPSEQATMTVTVRNPSPIRRSPAGASFTPDPGNDPSRQIATWLIDQWRLRYAYVPDASIEPSPSLDRPEPGGRV
jgi:hypothetical protein